MTNLPRPRPRAEARGRRRWLPAPTVAALLAAAAAPAGADSLQAWSAQGELRLFEVGDGSRLEASDSAGRRAFERVLQLPAATITSSLVALRDDHGFALAGSAPRAGGRTDLVLLLGDRGGERRLRAPLPGAAESRPRAEPSLLAHDGALAGLVWLEGDTPRRHEVWAADWRGSHFGRPYQLAARGPGSQVSLSAAVLANGDWLVVWSAFDGRDDEIRARLRHGGRWQDVVRVHPDNDVPDLVPRVYAAGSGALLAWSTYDGNDYRLALARYDGAGWSAPALIGERGTVYPAFSGPAAAPRLVYYGARPESWTLLELDPAGRELRRAQLLIARNDPPLVEVAAAGDGGGDRDADLVTWRFGAGRSSGEPALERRALFNGPSP